MKHSPKDAIDPERRRENSGEMDRRKFNTNNPPAVYPHSRDHAVQPNPEPSIFFGHSSVTRYSTPPNPRDTLASETLGAGNEIEGGATGLQSHGSLPNADAQGTSLLKLQEGIDRAAALLPVSLPEIAASQPQEKRGESLKKKEENKKVHYSLRNRRERQGPHEQQHHVTRGHRIAPYSVPNRPAEDRNNSPPPKRTRYSRRRRRQQDKSSPTVSQEHLAGNGPTNATNTEVNVQLPYELSQQSRDPPRHTPAQQTTNPGPLFLPGNDQTLQSLQPKQHGQTAFSYSNQQAPPGGDQLNELSAPGVSTGMLDPSLLDLDLFDGSFDFNNLSLFPDAGFPWLDVPAQQQNAAFQQDGSLLLQQQNGFVQPPQTHQTNFPPGLPPQNQHFLPIQQNGSQQHSTWPSHTIFRPLMPYPTNPYLQPPQHAAQTQMAPLQRNQQPSGRPQQQYAAAVFAGPSMQPPQHGMMQRTAPPPPPPHHQSLNHLPSGIFNGVHQYCYLPPTAPPTAAPSPSGLDDGGEHEYYSPPAAPAAAAPITPRSPSGQKSTTAPTPSLASQRHQQKKKRKQQYQQYRQQQQQQQQSRGGHSVITQDGSLHELAAHGNISRLLEIDEALGRLYKMKARVGLL